MANLVITQACVRRCPYCFASTYMDQDRSRQFMSWDNFIYAVDFLDASHEPAMSLMGGEPSLHPDFSDFVAYSLRRMRNVTVFTSGVMPSSKIAALREAVNTLARPRQILFVCNVNEPDITPPEQWARTSEFLEAFGIMVVQGFNIYRPEFSLDSLLENILRFNLSRSIRIGLAHPIYGAPNACLSPAQYRGAIERLASFAPKLEAYKIQLLFDCGFPVCGFSNEFLGQLMKLDATFNWKCAPVLDIGPDLTIWPCFPLSRYDEKRLTDFSSTREIIDYFIDLLRRETRDTPGMYDECDVCRHHQQRCNGGCLAHLLPRPATMAAELPATSS